MAGTYPRSANPYLRMTSHHRRRYRKAVACLRRLGRSMGGRLIINTWLNIRGDEAGWHQSESVSGMNHLTIKSEALKADGRRREDTGHILSNGSIEDWGSPYPNLEWLGGERLAPGMNAIATLEELNQGHGALLKRTRRALSDEFCRNGIGGEY